MKTPPPHNPDGAEPGHPKQALRQKAEESLRRNTERLQAIIAILQHNSANMQEFLDYALDKAIEVTGSKIGYIYFYDEEQRQFVLNSWSKDVMKECAVASPLTIYELDKTGVWGEAVRQRKPILLNDFQAHHPHKKGYPEGHVHLARFLTIPVFYQGRIVAVAGVANKETDYNETDVLEMTLLMDAVWKSAEALKGEETMQRERAMLARTESVAHVGSWEWEAEGDKVTWSDELFRIFGLEPAKEAPPFAEHQSFYVPEDRARLAQAVEECMKNGTPYDMEVRVRRIDGAVRHCVVRGYSENVSDGTVKRLYGSLHDITERKIAEETIKRSYDLLHNLSILVPGVIYQYRLYPDGRSAFPYSSPGIYNIYEVTPEEVQEDATPVFGRLHPEDSERVNATILESARTLETFRCEFRVLLPEQGLGWRWSLAEPQRTEDGGTLWHGIILDITERKRTEEALRESEQKFQTLINQAPVALFLHEKDGSIVDYNQLALDTYGYSADEIHHIKTSDIDPDYHEREDRGSFWEDLNRKKQIRFEARHRRKNGVIFPVEINLAPIEIKGKQLYLALALDITERKQAEEALRESEALLSQSQEIAHIGSWKLDLIANRLTWSDEVYRIFGCKPQEFAATYEAFLNFVHPDDRAAVDEAYSHSLREGNDSYEIEHRIVRQNSDELRYVHERGVHQRDAAGTIIQSTGMVQDITERKLAEIYREMGQEILQILNEPGDLKESIPRVLTVLKTRTGVDAVSLRLQEGEDFPYFAQYGFPEDFLQTENTLVERDKNGGVCRDKEGNVSLECTCGLVLSGKTDPASPLFTQGGSCWTNDSFPLLDLPSDQDPRLNPRNNCIHHGYASVALIPVQIQGQLYSRQACIRHEFRSMAQVAVRTSDRIVGLIQLNDKRKSRFTLATIEILEGIAAHIGSALMRKRAQAEREILQVQLNQAQKMESVGRLAGGVAHDFNNMLNVILGYTELALMNIAADSPLREDLNEISKAAERSANLTRQLLAFARKQTIAPKVLDLNETVTTMLKMLERLIGEDIDLLWKPSHNLAPIRIDPGQIDQLLANLAVNARDAIGQNTGKVTIETKNACFDEEYCANHAGFIPGDYVMLAVSDDGCGMNEETRSHIFEPFFTTKAIGQGTGLGLATIYGIVKQNNGFVNVYSEPGEGTTFSIYLPALEVESFKQDDARDTAAALVGGTETILIVEDEATILSLARAMLERLGYTVLTAANPSEALRTAREQSVNIDLLITDVVMPEMNGRDLARSLQEFCPDMHRLFMSGYTANVIAHQGVLDEGVNFVQKPFSLNNLAMKVREALEK